jgi:hypothetical protein
MINILKYCKSISRCQNRNHNTDDGFVTAAIRRKMYSFYFDEISSTEKFVTGMTLNSKIEENTYV